MKPKLTTRLLPVTTLLPHPDNPPERIDPATVTDLSLSVREHGILQPLVVTEHLTEPDHWTILAGHRRWAAAKLAGLTYVPCIVRHGLDEAPDEQNIVMLVENCQRRDLEPMARAEMFGALRKRGLTMAEISRRTGLSEGRISESLALLELDGETRERVRDGQVGVGQAMQAIRQVRATRATSRPNRPRAVSQAGVTVEAAWFTSKHKLADKVRAMCDHTNAAVGRVRPTVGGLGCGQCWEQAIREDELA